MTSDPCIWKFPLPHGLGLHKIDMPAPGKILSAGLQDGQVVLWASCSPDPETHKVSRLVELCFTGDRTPLDATLIATLSTHAGLIIHVFSVNP